MSCELVPKVYVTVPKLLKGYGFSVMEAPPTDEQAQEFLRVMEMTNRADLKFTPFVPVVYEKRLSEVTYLIVEATPIRNTYYYDFYRTQYILQDGSPSGVKVYCKGVRREELIRVVQGYFEKIQSHKNDREGKKKGGD